MLQALAPNAAEKNPLLQTAQVDAEDDAAVLEKVPAAQAVQLVLDAERE